MIRVGRTASEVRGARRRAFERVGREGGNVGRSVSRATTGGVGRSMDNSEGSEVGSDECCERGMIAGISLAANNERVEGCG